MILDLLIAIIYNAIAIVVNIFVILPDVTLSQDITDAIAQIGPYYKGIETVFPIGTLISILAIELIFITSYFGYKIIRWGYRKIPGIT
jgi:hypothetical protein